MEQENLSQFDEFEAPNFKRRALIPLWIQVFCWLFMIMGLFAFLSFIMGLFGNSAGVEFYGLNDSSTLSLTGLTLTSVLLFKGFTAYSLWFEKDNAITLVKIDAATGIIICIAVMIITGITQGGNFSLRFEILFLLAYFIKISNIEYSWYNKQY